MTLGKKERMIAVVLFIVVLAVAIHFLIFQKKAQTYDATSQEYTAAKEQLNTAEFINDQQAFTEYQQRTDQYSDLVTSVVAELNLQKADASTSPPIGAIDQWASQTIVLLNQLNERRGNGRVTLTFLEQAGWDLSAQLPAVGAVGALADRVSNLNNIYPQLQYITEPMAQARARQNYNASLTAVGIPPQQTSYFYYQPMQLFFNSEQWLQTVMRSSNMGGSNQSLAGFYNPYGLQRFGAAVPLLKKIWIYNLISQQLQRESSTTPLNPATLLRFGEALEPGIPLAEPEPLNSINKQLRALLDIIDIAARTGIQEIVSVKLLRPINVAKATLFEPGATPVPTPVVAATPANPMGMMMDPMMMDMGMGMDGGMGVTPGLEVTPVPDAERVGTGAGIELELRGDNASLTRFYYELSHLTRTYGIDDLYIFNDQQGGLRTTATIEVITDVNLDAASAGAPVQ